MISIHPVHHRLAELTVKAERIGGFDKLPVEEQTEMFQCLQANTELIRKIEGLKQLSFIALQTNDTEWHFDICRQLDELEKSWR
jgi:hypothetical protein